jgi:hypothetical protein
MRDLRVLGGMVIGDRIVPGTNHTISESVPGTDRLRGYPFVA